MIKIHLINKKIFHQNEKKENKHAFCSCISWNFKHLILNSLIHYLEDKRNIV